MTGSGGWNSSVSSGRSTSSACQAGPIRLGGRLERALGGRQVEEPLERGVHDRAPDGGGAGPLGQLVDDPEPVEQRAGHEVAGPRRRQRADHRRAEVDRTPQARDLATEVGALVAGMRPP